MVEGFSTGAMYFNIVINKQTGYDVREAGYYISKAG